MLRIILLLIVCFSTSLIKAEWLLSDSAKVSFINCEVGSKPYSAFGHSALRFTDSLNKFDVVFNYGAFNASEQDFYLNFIRGSLKFYLVIERVEDFIEGYIMEGRKVTEIPLMLSKTDKQQIFNFLMWNAETENAAYNYNFFDDNCASRLRDVLELKPVNKIQLNYRSNLKTARQLLNEYLSEMPWMKFIFYVLLGYKSDLPVSAKESTFLPHYLRMAILTANDGSRIIAGNEKVILNDNSALIKPSLLTHPIVVISAVLLLLCCGCLANSNKLRVLSTAFILIITGLIGCILCYLWFCTSHTLTAHNLNLLWANPINLLIGLLVIFRSNASMLKYIKFYSSGLVVLGLYTFISPQEFYPAFKMWIPIIGVLIFWCSTKITSPK